MFIIYTFGQEAVDTHRIDTHQTGTARTSSLEASRALRFLFHAKSSTFAPPDGPLAHVSHFGVLDPSFGVLVNCAISECFHRASFSDPDGESSCAFSPARNNAPSPQSSCSLVQNGFGGIVRGCSLSNSKSLSGGLLFGNSSLRFVTLLHISAFLDTVELNMAVGGKVWTDATVGTVGSSASLNGSLDNNVVDDALVDIESLSLSISLQVDKKLLDGLAGLFWPTTEGKTVHLGL